jgi:hypothetical protein
MLTPALRPQRAGGPSPSLLITSNAGGKSLRNIHLPSLIGTTYHSQANPRHSKVVSNAYDPRNPQQLANPVATPHSGYHFDGSPRRCEINFISIIFSNLKL